MNRGLSVITAVVLGVSGLGTGLGTGFARAEPAAESTSPKRNGETSMSLHSTITGNQEQPKVLYIVPWQGPGGADQLNTGLQPIVSDVFAPIDRREFQRELKYREMTLEAQPAPDSGAN